MARLQSVFPLNMLIFHSYVSYCRVHEKTYDPVDVFIILAVATMVNKQLRGILVKRDPPSLCLFWLTLVFHSCRFVHNPQEPSSMIPYYNILPQPKFIQIHIYIYIYVYIYIYIISSLLGHDHNTLFQHMFQNT